MQTATDSPRSACMASRLVPGLGLALGLALAQGSLSPALAAGTTGSASFMACAGEQDDARRLACFDAAVAQARAQPAPPVASAAPTAAAAAVAVPLSKEERFGLRGDLKQEKAKQAPELAELKELRATGDQSGRKTLRRARPDARQRPGLVRNPGQLGIRVKVGDQVTIRSGALGSYSVVAPNGRSSKVTRVR